MDRAPAVGLATPLLALSGLARAQAEPAVGQASLCWDSGACSVTEATRLWRADRYSSCIHTAPVARDHAATQRFCPVEGLMDGPAASA